MMRCKSCTILSGRQNECPLSNSSLSVSQPPLPSSQRFHLQQHQSVRKNITLCTSAEPGAMHPWQPTAAGCWLHWGPPAAEALVDSTGRRPMHTICLCVPPRAGAAGLELLEGHRHQRHQSRCSIRMALRRCHQPGSYPTPPAHGGNTRCCAAPAKPSPPGHTRSGFWCCRHTAMWRGLL